MFTAVSSGAGCSSAFDATGVGSDRARSAAGQSAELNNDAAKSREQAQVIEDLATTDREVRSHEQAHLAAAGRYARSAPSYEYVTGPDGRYYAVGGEVSIDISSVPGDPEATIQKAQTVRAAALAPADPSSQDRAVAAAATQLEAQASTELREAQQKLLENYGASKPEPGSIISVLA